MQGHFDPENAQRLFKAIIVQAALDATDNEKIQRANFSQFKKERKATKRQYLRKIAAYEKALAKPRNDRDVRHPGPYRLFVKAAYDRWKLSARKHIDDARNWLSGGGVNHIAQLAGWEPSYIERLVSKCRNGGWVSRSKVSALDILDALDPQSAN